MADNKPQATADEITSSLGDISGLTVLHNQVLLAIHMRGTVKELPNGQKLYLTDKTSDEDKWQGKVGLVVKKGAGAFVSDGQHTFSPDEEAIKLGDWLVYRISDGFPIDVNGVHCRLIDDQDVKAIVSDPAIIY